MEEQALKWQQQRVILRLRNEVYMTYISLKQELDILQQSQSHIKCKGFSESLQFEHFKTFFELKDAPNYTILQGKNNPEYGTTEDMWYLAYAKNNQMVVLDISDEETICDEFYQLMIIWFQGTQEVQTRPKL